MPSGTEGYWQYRNNVGTLDSSGYLAATASAALAFIEEGYLPGSDVIIGATNYGDVVGKACDYIFQRATTDTEGIYFNPGIYQRSVYTTGLVAPVIYALGDANPDAVIGRGSAVVSSSTYRQAMQGVVDWYVWGQNPDGGWRYYPNYGGSDNSTAQWGSLPLLYGQDWGLTIPASTYTDLESWVGTVQHPMDGTWQAGGSGYNNNYTYVNMAKTGGMLLELAAIGVPLSDARVQNALAYMTSMVDFDHWNQGPVSELYTLGQWYGGNLDNPYAMWAVYKALATYGLLETNDNGTPGDPTDDFVIGTGIGSAPGGFTIGQDWATQTSLAGDWYSQYSDLLVSLQNGDGSWNGFSYWSGALATGWYINILNATGAPPPSGGEVPEPATMLLLGTGLIGLAGFRKKFMKK